MYITSNVHRQISSTMVLSKMVTLSDRCDKLANVDYGNFTISLCLLIGIFVSYLPQHLRIILRRSSFGLSPYFVGLGTTSATCAFANILVLPTSRKDVHCCSEISGFACFAGLLGIGQIGIQWISFTIILLLFLVFFPRATPPITHLSPDNKEEKPSFKTALYVVGICTVHAIFAAILSFYFVLIAPEHQWAWANFLGIMATILSSIQYFPQIYTTYKLKSVESLSIPMMCIQTPGGYVWATSLAIRLGPEAWSAWGVYLVTATLQGVLLVMGSYFEISKKLREKKELKARIAAGTNDSQITAYEETPLLRAAE